MKKCSACEDIFKWDDDVIIVDDKFYHDDCVTVFPSAYFAMLDGDPLGETENEDGSMAFEIMEEGEYEKD